MSQFYVYILANGKKGTLYVGVTRNLLARIEQHRSRLKRSFTDRYDVLRLVHYEVTEYFMAAVQREKRLKKWNREWKIRLIEETNPEWKDLYDEIRDG